MSRMDTDLDEDWACIHRLRPLKLVSPTGINPHPGKYVLVMIVVHSSSPLCVLPSRPAHGPVFEQLPYLMDGDVGVTQSNAIMRYVGRKHDLLGKTEQERVRVDIMENQSMDFRNGWVRLCYNPNFVSHTPTTPDSFTSQTRDV